MFVSRAMIMAGGEGLWSSTTDAERVRISREEDLYKQEMIRLESDLTYVLIQCLLFRFIPNQLSILFNEKKDFAITLSIVTLSTRRFNQV